MSSIVISDELSSYPSKFLSLFIAISSPLFADRVWDKVKKRRKVKRITFAGLMFLVFMMLVILTSIQISFLNT